MIIKKKHSGQSTTPKSKEAVKQAPAWTPDHIASGLVPERRAATRDSDRRRGFRRVEDRELISKAHEEANAIREKAQQEGFNAGLDEAAHVLDELKAVIATHMTLREQALESVVQEISGLAMEVAARVIKTEVSCDETLVLSIVRDTIQKSGQRSGHSSNRGVKSILVKVNPDDVAAVKAAVKADTIPSMNAELIVMGEPTVDLGSCIIETDSGLIDASFTTQLEILYRTFGLM
jgi:flagellar assembly protein FliH